MSTELLITKGGLFLYIYYDPLNPRKHFFLSLRKQQEGIAVSRSPRPTGPQHGGSARQAGDQPSNTSHWYRVLPLTQSHPILTNLCDSVTILPRGEEGKLTWAHSRGQVPGVLAPEATCCNPGLPAPRPPSSEPGFHLFVSSALGRLTWPSVTPQQSWEILQKKRGAGHKD